MLRLLLAGVAVMMFAAAGCQTIGKPISESGVDEELAAPAQSTPPPETTQSEPRPNFEQESPTSQSPP